MFFSFLKTVNSKTSTFEIKKDEKDLSLMLIIRRGGNVQIKGGFYPRDKLSLSWCAQHGIDFTCLCIYEQSHPSDRAH